MMSPVMFHKSMGKLFLVILLLQSYDHAFTSITSDHDLYGNAEIPEEAYEEDRLHLPSAVGNGPPNVLSIGASGPIVIPEADFLRKLSHFSRERIPRRRNAEHGNGAFGHFTCGDTSIKYLTTAAIFSEYGKKTPVMVRFVAATTVGGGETDRGFFSMSVKFYTDKGNFDLTSTSPPIFSTNEPIRIMNLLHARQEGFNASIDYATGAPETIVVPIVFFSDTGTPASWRRMPSHYPSTYKLRNKDGDFIYVRFKFVPELEFKYLDDAEMARLRGIIPDYISRDLYTAIERGEYPRWQLRAQLITREAAKKASFNVFDPSKIWDEKDYPSVFLGELELNKNIDNHFSQVEQIAFDPSSIIPGIEHGPDRNLQGRVFAYHDAQSYRLGVNYRSLGINRARKGQKNPSAQAGLCFQPDDSGESTNDGTNVMEEGLNNFSSTMKSLIRRLYNISYEKDNYSHNKLWNSYCEDEKKRLLTRLSIALAHADALFADNFVNEVFRINRILGARLTLAVEEGREVLQARNQEEKFLQTNVTSTCSENDAI
ncbi:vegetative catalase-like [Brevipalpus obovatus]|uniref:vegetative catalase-like n=1 Tax=Brevipalpus obovatus TaxID=246614 RepID=UPI003D9EC1F3